MALSFSLFNRVRELIPLVLAKLRQRLVKFLIEAQKWKPRFIAGLLKRSDEVLI